MAACNPPAVWPQAIVSQIEKALSNLSRRERQILRLCFLMNASDAQLRPRMQLTPVQLRHIQARAFRKLRVGAVGRLLD